MTSVEAVALALLGGFVCGWLARATAAGRRVAMPEKPTEPPNVNSPKPPPVGVCSQGYNPPPVARVVRPTATPAPPLPKPPEIHVVVAERVQK